MNNTDLLNLIDITVSFEGFLALNKLNLNLKKGELRAVIGPNLSLIHISEPTRPS